MSAFIAEPARSDDIAREARDGVAVTGSGQRHNRLETEEHNARGAGSKDVGGRDSDVSATQKMISATWGSVLTSLLVTPLDVVRVRLQSQAPPSPPTNPTQFPAYTTNFKKLPPDLGVTSCCRDLFWVNNAQSCMVTSSATPADAIPATSAAAECAADEAQRKTFTSTFDGLRKISRNEGILTLWRGLSPTLLMAVPGNVIYFTGYDWLRYNHLSPINQMVPDTYAPLIAGAGARVAAGVVVSPIEMFRTRMQATSGSGTGIFKDTLVGLYQMTQSRGYTSLWRGLTLTLWRDVPFSGIYWWGYEAFRNSFTDMRERARGSVERGPDRERLLRDSQVNEHHTITFLDSFAAGFASGGLAAFVTTPFDVGKTRQQTYKNAADSGVKSSTVSASEVKKLIPEELPMPRFLFHIFREEGISGLFKGWGPRCLKVAPACAIMISSYEVGKKWARGINEKQEEDSL
ncbi:MAG: hypothetical protein Q9227_008009 [Pyrenula ochraceoflavens]